MVSALPDKLRLPFGLVILPTIIALIGGAACPVGALAASGNDGVTVINPPTENTYYLPLLGNTEESDRKMLREVSDRHVFDPEPLATAGEAVASDVTGNGEQATLQHDSNDLWAVIRASEPMRLRVTKAVEDQKQQYLQDSLWVNKILERAKPFLPSIVARLDERHLPLDLALIPAVESGFQSHVSSSGAAAGLWQIVPVTAKEIGLKRNTWFDQRTDLVHSTRAALDYLSYLNAEFHGDWELTLAAYNAGPGRVKAAVRKAKNLDEPTDFWSLKLPSETRAYVPKFTALIKLIREMPESQLLLPQITTEATFEIVDVGRRISLDKASALAGISEAEIRSMNGGLLHGVTPPKGPHKILLPIDSVTVFKQNLEAVSSPELYSLPKIHVVEAGDSISSIAAQYGIKQKTLKALNGLASNKILLGQKLAVLDAKQATSGGSSKTTGAATDLLSYTIKSGDTLSAIARRFNVKMADITFQQGNSAEDRILIPGKKLQILIHPKDGNG